MLYDGFRDSREVKGGCLGIADRFHRVGSWATEVEEVEVQEEFFRKETEEISKEEKARRIR